MRFKHCEYDTVRRVINGQWHGRHSAQNLGRQRELERRQSRVERERQLGHESE